jgi:hypothetical protein
MNFGGKKEGMFYGGDDIGRLWAEHRVGQSQVSYFESGCSTTREQ